MKTELQHVLICKNRDGTFTVAPIWSNVDRPYTGGISVGKNHALGCRLTSAWYAGVVCDMSKVSIATDIRGQTYADVPMLNVRGRTLNADLKKLGY